MSVDTQVLLDGKSLDLFHSTSPPTLSISRELEGGAICSTSVRFDELELNPMTGRTDPRYERFWLREVMSDALADAHGDVRGVLLFPDVIEPSGKIYAKVVKQVAKLGRWVVP